MSHSDGSSDVRIEFHNAVMRWKCSNLTDEEHQEVQDVIERRAREKEEVKQYTGDELSKENEVIQRYPPLPPSTAPKTNMSVQVYQCSPSHDA